MTRWVIWREMRGQILLLIALTVIGNAMNLILPLFVSRGIDEYVAGTFLLLTDGSELLLVEVGQQRGVGGGCGTGGAVEQIDREHPGIVGSAPACGESHAAFPAFDTCSASSRSITPLL